MKSTTTVVNLRLEPCDVKICRTQDNRIPDAPQAGCFGNPIILKNKYDEVERAECVRKHKIYLWAKAEMDLNFRKALLSLRGKRLGCFCKQPDREVACHGDNIVAWLEEFTE